MLNSFHVSKATRGQPAKWALDGASLFMFSLFVLDCAVTESRARKKPVTVQRIFLRSPKSREDETEVFLFKPKVVGPFPARCHDSWRSAGSHQAIGWPGVFHRQHRRVPRFARIRGHGSVDARVRGLHRKSGFYRSGDDRTVGLRNSVFPETSYVDGELIAIFGDSRGATVAALLARKVSKVRGLTRRAEFTT